MSPPRARQTPRATGTRPAYTVTMLSLLMVFSLMDRQILSILLEPIKRDLGTSDSSMGLLGGLLRPRGASPGRRAGRRGLTTGPDTRL